MVTTRNKLLATTLTIFLLAILIVSSPANAFILSLNSDKATVDTGEDVVFNADININSNTDKNLPVYQLVLELDGPEHVSCEFRPDGTIISGCKGITIERIGGPSVGYGYGYGYYYGFLYNFGYGYGYNGQLNYKITLHTDDYLAGEYSTKLYAYIDGKVFSQTGQTLTINEAEEEEPEPVHFPSECYTSWTCEPWSPCVEGEQTRICEKRIIGCLADESKPEESRSCTIQLKPRPSDLTLSEDDIITIQNNSDISQNNRSGITGAVIGVVGEPGTMNFLIVMLLLVLILIMLILLVFTAQRNRRIRIRRRVTYRNS